MEFKFDPSTLQKPSRLVCTITGETETRGSLELHGHQRHPTHPSDTAHTPTRHPTHPPDTPTPIRHLTHPSDATHPPDTPIPIMHTHQTPHISDTSDTHITPDTSDTYITPDISDIYITHTNGQGYPMDTPIGHTQRCGLLNSKIKYFQKLNLLGGMAVHTFNPSMTEAEGADL